MGTDGIGRDVAALMVHGARTAMLVSIISMGIATLIGLLLGSLAGFFGDDRLRVSTPRLLLNLVALAAGLFYGFGVRSFAIGEGLWLRTAQKPEYPDCCFAGRKFDRRVG